MSFQNIYYKRTTATSRACYVCNKPTTVCLATSNAVDFLYACETHLSDTGFATELVDPSTASASTSNPTAAVSKEEIARVKAEWEAKEARKKAKENGKSGAEGKEAEREAAGGDGKKNDGAKSPSPSIPGGVSSSPSSSSPPSGSSAAATPTHKRYSLHRDFYAMRQAEHRRRGQTKQMQELAPRLPGAPRGSPLG